MWLGNDMNSISIDYCLSVHIIVWLSEKENLFPMVSSRYNGCGEFY